MAFPIGLLVLGGVLGGALALGRGGMLSPGPSNPMETEGFGSTFFDDTQFPAGEFLLPGPLLFGGGTALPPGLSADERRRLLEQLTGTRISGFNTTGETVDYGSSQFDYGASPSNNAESAPSGDAASDAGPSGDTGDSGEAGDSGGDGAPSGDDAGTGTAGPGEGTSGGGPGGY